MYERSAIVLERYFDNLFGFYKQYNLKENCIKFEEFLEQIVKYQEAINNEETVINEFDEVAKEIQMIQKTQEKLNDSNIQLENERTKLFNDLDEDPSLIEKKLIKIEEKLNSNNEKLEELRINFIKYLKGFSDKQKERNKFTKARRIAESGYINFTKDMTEYIQNIDVKDIKKLKEFMESDNVLDVKNLSKQMCDNGKNERVKFNQEVLDKAINERMKLAREEAQCYILIYDRTRKLLNELESDNLKLSKYQKNLKDVKTRLEFVNAEKDYIVGFLDNERMTAMNGPNVHKKMMNEACENFELDIVQIKNLYDLLIKEISGKATKKIYRELYNNNYLKEIEEKEKSFEEEVSNINITGTFINSNYWRLEGIKNIYTVFETQVTENYDRDLSEFKPQEEIEDEEIDLDDNQQIFSSKNNEFDEQDDYDYYYDDDYEEDDEDVDYDENEDEEYEEDEYDDEDYDDEEYEDEYDDEDEDYYDEEDEDEEDDDDEYYDDEEDEYDEDEEDDYDEYDEDEDYEEDDESENISKKNNKNVNRKNNVKKQNVSNRKPGNINNKKESNKNNKSGIFRNFLGKMKNENKS